ncbi:restriction endonuclease subunit S [Methanobrevibacter millerae]|nr:restriction endonuclease subunit S [Methanobrevibacter millerae]
MNKKRLIPKLRFAGFDDEWKCISLSDISKIKDGTHASHKIVDDGVYLLSSKDVFNGKIHISDDSQQISHEDYNKLHKKYKIENGDVLLTIIGSTCRTAVIKDYNNEYTFRSSVAIIKTSENPYFLETYFNTPIFIKDFKKRINVTAYESISLRDLSKINVNLPSIKEQQKISNFILKIDNKIEILEKKCKAYVDFKKYLIQQIFAQKLRFKDENSNFSENWEQLQLKDIISLNGGYAFKSELFKEEGMPIVRISNISSNNSVILDDLVYYDKLDNDSDFIIKKGELIIAMSGATTGKVAVYDLEHESYINQRVGLFKKTSPKLYYPFLVQYTLSNSFKRELQKTLVAGAQPNISKKEIESFKINLPQYEEQKKIADFLSDLDLKINTIKKQNSKISMFKKSLLQQMFV